MDKFIHQTIFYGTLKKYNTTAYPQPSKAHPLAL